MYQIDNYSIISRADRYTAPEVVSKQVQGQVKNHPKYQDGEMIITSDIIGVQGRVIKTLHSEYELLTPDPKWFKWMKERGLDRGFDPKNPIKYGKSDL